MLGVKGPSWPITKIFPVDPHEGDETSFPSAVWLQLTPGGPWEMQDK